MFEEQAKKDDDSIKSIRAEVHKAANGGTWRDELFTDEADEGRRHKRYRAAGGGGKGGGKGKDNKNSDEIQAKLDKRITLDGFMGTLPKINGLR